MAGLGATELLIILAVLLLLFGSARLPRLARSLGQSVRILKTEADRRDTDPEPAAPPRLDAPGGPAAPGEDRIV